MCGGAEERRCRSGGQVLNTLQGEYRDIRNPVKILDFPFPYTHVNPFPTDEALEEKVDTSFNEVFNTAAGFLK